MLIAGEVACQLRSALDHLVWQLVIANTGEPPIVQKTQFPIFENEKGYDDRGVKMIVGVSDSAQELNNTDKHRIIPVTATYCFVGSVRMTKKDGTVVDIVPPQAEVRERLQHNTEIARLSAIGDLDNVRIDLSLGFDIAFEKVGGETLEPATHRLMEMTSYVTKLIESFDVECRTEPTTVIVFGSADLDAAGSE